MSSDLPYKCQYSVSGRAKCRGCDTKIAKDVFRLAVMVESEYGDGKTPHWYHNECFFKTFHPSSELQIDGYQNIRIEDQNYIKEKIGSAVSVGVPEVKAKAKTGEKSVADAGTSKATMAVSKKNIGSAVSVGVPEVKATAKSVADEDTKATTDVYKNLSIEFAVSNRSSCTVCQNNIGKGDMRMKKGKIFFHLNCFAEEHTERTWLTSPELLPGFVELPEIKKATVREALSAIKQDQPGLLVKQKKKYFELKETLKGHTKKDDWIDILRLNNQYIPEKSKILDHVTDVILFGALEPCDKCKDGQFILSNLGYVCTGKCGNIQEEPKRKAVEMPYEIRRKREFFNRKFEVQTRALQHIAPIPLKSVENEEGGDMDGPRTLENPPLYNMEFVIVGETEQSKDDIENVIQQMGGKVGKTIHKNVAAIISTADEVKRLVSPLKKAKKLGIHVVPEDFLEDVKKNGNPISCIINKELCDWGKDPRLRIPMDNLTKSESKDIFMESMPKSEILNLKGGAVVDKDANLKNVHVYQKDNLIYSASLCHVDIDNDKNSYYNIQLLEHDNIQLLKYWFFRSWGRIGTMRGKTLLKKCSNLNEAIGLFEETFLRKTNNSFGSQTFDKKPGKYYKLENDYAEEEKKLAEINTKSKLPESTQNLIKLMFNVDEMTKVMLELDVDLEKMPLGKLSQKQLKEAMGVLKKIEELIQSGNATKRQLTERSNQFYTLVPHDFGIEPAPILETNDQVATKVEMIESLMGMELSVRVINGDNTDSRYEQLKTDIVPIPHDSEEFALLCAYVQNTHGETHSSLRLEIEEIFRVAREGEVDRYKPFKELQNRQLLWHGSRLTNFVSILSQGLRIAPLEAPMAGYMFGKGIYFADVVSKSAQYCRALPGATGLMLLCEVALGNTKDCYKAEWVDKLPTGKHSVKGIGKTYPNPREIHTLPDGVQVPLGKLIEGKAQTLRYNEYVVYDEAQVKIQYLFKMNFKFK